MTENIIKREHCIISERVTELFDKHHINRSLLYFEECEIRKFGKFVIHPENVSKIGEVIHLIGNSKFCLVKAGNSSGKNVLLRTVAKALNYKLDETYVLRMGSHIDYRDLIGFYANAETSANFEWRDGLLVTCAKKGFFLILDGWDQVSTETAQFLSGLLDNGCCWPTTSNKIIPHERFRMCSTFNSDRNPNSLSIATALHRWNIIEITSISASNLEYVFIAKFPRLEPVKQILINFYQLVCTVAHTSVSELFRLCSYIEYFVDLSDSSRIDPIPILTMIDAILAAPHSDSIKKEIMTIASNLFSVAHEWSAIEIEAKMKEYVEKHVMFENMFAVTKSAYAALYSLQLGISRNEPALLIGETGVGKTSLVQRLAHMNGKKLCIINMGRHTDVTTLLGSIKPYPYSKQIQNLVELFSVHFGRINSVSNEPFVESLNSLISQQKWRKTVRAVALALDALAQKGHGSECIETIRKIANKLACNIPLHDCVVFNHVYGALAKSIMDGSWVLIDEINLAPDDVLAALSGILQNQITCLYNHISLSTMHRDFRLFACMNPPTDVGKKRLPTSVYDRFVKIRLNPIVEVDELIQVIATYLDGFDISRMYQSIALFYINFKRYADAHLYMGSPILVSLRTLCRSLKTAQMNISGNIYQSLKDGIYLSFFASLNQSGVIEWKKYMRAHLPDLYSILKFTYDTENKSIVLVEGFPIKKGAIACVNDKKYILTKLLKKKLRVLARIVALTDAAILLEGDTAVGKTSLISYIAKRTGNTCVRINNHEHTDINDYIGNYTSDSRGQIVFQNGVIIQAMQKGHWVIFDELNLAPSDVLEMLNRLLDDNRELYIDETQELIRAHPDFRVFATQNPAKSYSGRNELSKAFRNRFIEIPFHDVCDVEHIIEILQKRYQLSKAISNFISKILLQFRILRKESDIFTQKYGFITIRDVLKWTSRFIIIKQPSIAIIAKIGFEILSSKCRSINEIKIITETITQCLPINICVNFKTDYFSQTSLNNIIKFAQIAFPSIVYTKPMLRNTYLTLCALSNKEPVLLIGDTGSGKTSTCQIFAASTNRQLYSYNCHSNMESSDIIGRLTVSCVNGNKIFQWTDGLLTEAMRTGGVFLLDEISLANDAVLERVNSVLESQHRSLVLYEKLTNASTPEELTAHPDFIFIATMNPSGDYGKRELSPSLRNRFTEIWCESSQNDQLEMILHHNLHINARQFNINNVNHSTSYIILKVLHDIYEKHHKISITTRRIIYISIFINKHINSTNPIISILFQSIKTIFIDCYDKNKRNSLTNHLNDYLIKTLKIDTNQINTLCADVDLHLPPQLTSPNYNSTAIEIKNSANRIHHAMLLNRPILLEGPPGCGKTTIVQQLATNSNVTIIRINVSEQTELSDLIGSYIPSPTKNTFQWSNGPLLTAILDQNWLLLDELNLANQRVLEGLNSCLDHRSQIHVPELSQTFTIDRTKTKIFATQNPHTSGGGRKGLPLSFTDRFLTLHIDPFSLPTLIHLATSSFPSTPPPLIHSISHHLTQLHPYYDFNIRDVLRTLQLIDFLHITSVPLATYVTFLKKLPPHPTQPSPQSTIDPKSFYSFFRITPSFIYLGPLAIPTPSSNQTRFNPSSLQLFPHQYEYLSIMSIAVHLKWPLLLSGPTSCKTTLVKLLAILHNVNLIVISLTADTDVSDITGEFKNINYLLKSLKLVNKLQLLFPSSSLLQSIKLDLLSSNISHLKHKTSSLPSNHSSFIKLKSHLNKLSSSISHIEWCPNTFLKSFLRPYWVLFDNINFSNSAVIDRLNTILEPDSFISINQNSLHPHRHFRFFATYDSKFGAVSHSFSNRCLELYLPPSSTPLSTDTNRYPHLSLLFSLNLQTNLILWDQNVISSSSFVSNLLLLESSTTNDIHHRISYINLGSNIIDVDLLHQISQQLQSFSSLCPLIDFSSNPPLGHHLSSHPLPSSSALFLFILRLNLLLPPSSFSQKIHQMTINRVKTSLFSPQIFIESILVSLYAVRIESYLIASNHQNCFIFIKKFNHLSFYSLPPLQQSFSHLHHNHLLSLFCDSNDSPFFNPRNVSFLPHALQTTNSSSSLLLISSISLLTSPSPSLVAYFSSAAASLSSLISSFSFDQQLFSPLFIQLFPSPAASFVISSPFPLLFDSLQFSSFQRLYLFATSSHVVYKISCQQIDSLLSDLNSHSICLWIHFTLYYHWDQLIHQALVSLLQTVIHLIFPPRILDCVSSLDPDLHSFLSSTLMLIDTHPSKISSLFIQLGTRLFSIFANLPTIDPTREHHLYNSFLSAVYDTTTDEIKTRLNLAELRHTALPPVIEHLSALQTVLLSNISTKVSLDRPNHIYSDLRHHLQLLDTSHLPFTLLAQYPMFADFLEPLLLSFNLIQIGHAYQESQTQPPATESNQLCDEIIRKLTQIDDCVHYPTSHPTSRRKTYRTFASIFQSLFVIIKSIIAEFDQVSFHNISTYQYNYPQLPTQDDFLTPIPIDSDRIRPTLDAVAYSVLSKLDNLINSSATISTALLTPLESTSEFNRYLNDLQTAKMLITFSESTNYENMNIYEDGSPFHVREVLSHCASLKTKMSTIKKQFEHHLIDDIMSHLDSFQTLLVSSPLIVFLDKLDTLFRWLINWNLSVSVEFKIVTELDSLKDLIVKLRKLQLTSWRNIFTNYDRQLRISNSLSLLQIFGELLESPRETLVEIIADILTNQSVGSFDFTLHAISNIVEFLVTLQPNSQLTAHLQNILGYYRQFSSQVTKFINDNTAKIREELREFSTLSTWRDFNYWSIKEASIKAHRNLHKYVKQYQTVMNHRVKYIFSAIAQPSYEILSQSVVPTKIVSIPPFTTVSHMHLTPKTISIADSLCKQTSRCIELCRQSLSIHETIRIITTSTRSLTSLATLESPTSKIQELQNLFSSLAHLNVNAQKGLREFQFDLFRNVHIWSSFDPTTITSEYNDIFQKCDAYFVHSIYRHVLFVDAISSKSPDVTNDQLKLMKGYSTHLRTIVIEQRKQLSFAIRVRNVFSELSREIEHVKICEFVQLSPSTIEEIINILAAGSENILKLIKLVEVRPNIPPTYVGPFFPNPSISISQLNDQYFYDDVILSLKHALSQISAAIYSLQDHAYLHPLVSRSDVDSINDILSACVNTITNVKTKFVNHRLLNMCVFESASDDICRDISQAVAKLRTFRNADVIISTLTVDTFIKAMLKFLETLYAQFQTPRQLSEIHEIFPYMEKLLLHLLRFESHKILRCLVGHNASDIDAVSYIVTCCSHVIDNYLMLLFQLNHSTSFLSCYVVFVFEFVVKHGVKPSEFVNHNEEDGGTEVMDNEVVTAGFGEGKGHVDATENIENQDDIEDTHKEESMFDASDEQDSVRDQDRKAEDEDGIEMSDDFRPDDQIEGEQDPNDDADIDAEDISSIADSEDFNQLNPEIWNQEEGNHMETAQTDIKEINHEEPCDEDDMVADEDNQDLPIESGSNDESKPKSDEIEDENIENDEIFQSCENTNIDENIKESEPEESEKIADDADTFAQNLFQKENCVPTRDSEREDIENVGKNVEHPESTEMGNKMSENHKDVKENIKPDEEVTKKRSFDCASENTSDSKKRKKCEIISKDEIANVCDVQESQLGQQIDGIESDILISVIASKSIPMDIDESREHMEDVFTEIDPRDTIDETERIITKHDHVESSKIDQYQDIDQMIPIVMKTEFMFDFNDCMTSVNSLACGLCERLRMILEPTRRNKFCGDFKTGRKLNMRRIVPYIASNFTRDKIWLRRSKPSDRQYNVIVALDDSSSMADNNSRMIAIQSVLVLTQAFRLLEVGKVSILSFGEITEILVGFDEICNDDKCRSVLESLKFDQNATRITDLVNFCANMFQSVGCGASCDAAFENLLIIISDGRGMYSEGERPVVKALNSIDELNVFTIFIVLDTSPLERHSISHLKVPVFSPHSTVPEIKSYLEVFPFSYYIILRDIHDLPQMIASISQQWLQILTI